MSPLFFGGEVDPTCWTKSQVLKENLFCLAYLFINIHLIWNLVVQCLGNSPEIIENNVEIKTLP